VQDLLNNNEIQPNYSDKIHIYKIICGAGNHSKNNEPRLKLAIPKMLLNQGYKEGQDFHADKTHGVFLVRLNKDG